MPDGPAPDAPALSVIVPSWGDRDKLPALLSSLAAQTLDRASFEVIVVDDGNDPPLDLDGAPLAVQLVRQRRAGPAAARNMAIRRARGSVLVFANADGALAPDALARHLAHHAPGAPPRAVLGRFDWLPRHRTPLVELAERAGVLFPYAHAAPHAANHFSFFWTGNLSAPTRQVRDAGGFDESFPRALWEDVELGYRLDRAGLPLWYDPDIGSDHDHAMPLDKWLHHARWFGHEWVRFARKHGGAAFPALGGADGPTDDLARDCLSALLHQNDPHLSRVAALGHLTERLAIAIRDAPDRRQALLDEAAGEATELLVGVNTLERMSGIAGAIHGHDPDALVDWRATLGGPSVVHTVLGDWDLLAIPRILNLLPRDAELLVASYIYLAAGRLPDDPRVRVVRVPPTLPTHQTWMPVLGATSRRVLIFLDDGPLPTASALRALVRFIGVSPRVGAIGLAGRQGLPHASAKLVPSAPRQVLATTRAVLEGDPGGPGSFLDRLAARGYEQAALTLAGE